MQAFSYKVRDYAATALQSRLFCARAYDRTRTHAALHTHQRLPAERLVHAPKKSFFPQMPPNRRGALAGPPTLAHELSGPLRQRALTYACHLPSAGISGGNLIQCRA